MEDVETNQAIACLKQKEAPLEDIERSVKLLAQRSKVDATLRSALGHLNVLEALVELFEKDIDQNWELIDAALRCIGNACADYDDARAIITDLGFEWATKCLWSGRKEALALVTSVIYNIINDFEPAQKECCEYGVDHALLQHCDLSSEEVDNNLISTLVDVLFLITAHLPAGDMGIDKSLSEKGMETLFALPLHCIATKDVEGVAESVEVMLPFLRDTTVQLQTLRRKQIKHILEILEKLDQFAEQLNSEGPGSAEDGKLVVPLCSSITWCLSDIAALPEFVMWYRLQDESIEELLARIDGAGQVVEGGADPSVHIPSRVALNAACQMIGNWLWSLTEGWATRSPETTKPYELATLVEQRALHHAVFSAILWPAVPGKTSDLLFSAAGLLIHLTRSSTRGQEIIGSDDQAVPALEILCRHPMEQVKHEGIRLLKALCIGNEENKTRFHALGVEVTADSSATGQPAS
jgi:hypothetical protein